MDKYPVLHCDPFMTSVKRVTIAPHPSESTCLNIKFEGTADSTSFTLNVWAPWGRNELPELIIARSFVPLTGKSADSLQTAADRYEPAESSFDADGFRRGLAAEHELGERNAAANSAARNEALEKAAADTRAVRQQVRAVLSRDAD